MYVLRPAALTDLPQIEAIAAKSAVGITSLPANRERLHEKIDNACRALAREVTAPAEENYFFVLENIDTNKIVGTCGMVAYAGFHDRFYSYRNEVIVHASRELKVSNKIHALHLCHDLTGYSLLTSFYIAPDLAGGDLPQLLSRARLLFLAEHRHRFADKLVAENPGVCDAKGRSAFWDAVGRRFFDMEYPQAERLSGGSSKTFIAELMPQYPIYLPLLPEAAQKVIGKVSDSGTLPFSILLAEGFETEPYVDIFDAGLTVQARVDTLRSIRGQQRLTVVKQVDEHAAACWTIIANTKTEQFRAVLCPLQMDQSGVCLDEKIAATLGVTVGDAVRVVDLNPLTGTGAAW